MPILALKSTTSASPLSAPDGWVMLIERNQMFFLEVHYTGVNLLCGVILLKFPKEQIVNSLEPVLDRTLPHFGLKKKKEKIRSHLGSLIIKKKMLKHNS